MHNSSRHYSQWTLDDDDDNHTSEPRVRSPPSRPPPSRRAPSLNDHQDDHESRSFSRLAGTSWLGHIAEEPTPPVIAAIPKTPEIPQSPITHSPITHCYQANQNAWDMTNEYNRAYYRTGLWDEGCLQYPYSFDGWNDAIAEEPNREDRSCGPSPETPHEIVQGENKFSHYTGKLETHYYNNDNEESIYYLKLQDIVNYVSRGCSISDEHQDSLLNYIKSNVQIDNWFDETRYTIAGTVYKKSMPAFHNHQYAVVAKYCLDWMISNPEKVSMPGM